MQQTTKKRQPQKQSEHYRLLVSRFLGASIVATASGQLVFLVAYALGAAPAVATALSFAGAIPNFLLNRRSWGRSTRESLRREIVRYGLISVSTALIAAFLTSHAEVAAQEGFPDNRTMQIAVVWGTFLGTYLVMFVVKFFLIDRLVFTALPQRGQAR